MKKKCPYCHKYYDSNENHMCPKKLAHQRKQEKQHREATFEANAVLHKAKWPRFRRRIITRDGGYCQRCWIKYHRYTFDQLEVHHIKPRIKYPELAFDPDNCVTLCKSCNDELGLDGIDFDWQPQDDESPTYNF